MKYIEMVRELAKFQGYYGRLLRELESDERKKTHFIKMCKKNNVEEFIDLIMLIEG